MSGREIRRIREALGYTQAQLAELLHVSNAAICRWESGARPISPAMADYVKIKASEARQTAVPA